MKKAKKRTRLWSALLALVMITLYTVPAFSAVIPEETVEPKTGDPGYMQPLTSYETEHSYDEGIIDGGVYYLRNAYNMQYMDVDNRGTANNTGLSTYTFHGEVNQQFRIHYIGNSLYELAPVYVEKRVQVNADHRVVIYDKSYGAQQKFRIQMLDNVSGVIFSEASGFTRALTWNVNQPQTIINQVYSTLSNKTHAQWIFERVGDTADRYANFYIRHFSTRHYVDAVDAGTGEGVLVHGTVYFHGGMNQEWKTYYDEADGCYYLKPGHRRDMAMDYRWDHIIICNDNQPSMQKFQIIASNDFDPATDTYLKFAIKTPAGGYLTLGSPMDGSNNDYRYIDITSTVDYCWVLEGVPHDATRSDTIRTLNTWQTGIVEPGYSQEQPFYFTATATKQYKVELKNGNVDFASIESDTGVNAEILTRKTANGTRIANAYLQAGTTYRISVYSKNAVDGSTTNFSIRIREMIAVGHSSMVDADGHNPLAAVTVAHFRQALNNTDYYIMTRDNMSASRALRETIDITGETYFKSDVFLYVGHGGKGYAVYDGTDNLYADELPNMSSFDLVVWACCYSADDPLGGQSLATKTYNDGAETVIGWEMQMNKFVTESYIQHLFDHLSNGESVDAASDAALDAVAENGNFSIWAIAEFTGGLYIGGNKNNTIVHNANPTIASTSALASLTNKSVAFDSSKYILIAENETEGLKVYARMINGIIADDYYIEFYNNGILTNISKSAYTIPDADAMMIGAQIQQLSVMNKTMNEITQTTQSEYLIQCIDGIWRLVKRRSVANDDCECCMQYMHYDALTGEVIQ